MSRLIGDYYPKKVSSTTAHISTLSTIADWDFNLMLCSSVHNSNNNPVDDCGVPSYKELECSSVVDRRSVESRSTCADVAIVHSPAAKHPIIDTLSPRFTFNKHVSDRGYTPTCCLSCVSCVSCVNLLELHALCWVAYDSEPERVMWDFGAGLSENAKSSCLCVVPHDNVNSSISSWQGCFDPRVCSRLQRL